MAAIYGMQTGGELLDLLRVLDDEDLEAESPDVGPSAWDISVHSLI